MLARQSKHVFVVSGYAVCESLIWCEVTIAPCLCLLYDPNSTRIPFLLCLQHVLCASFIPVHHPLRIWQTDLQLLSQAVQGVNWSKNVLCCTHTHTYTHTTVPIKVSGRLFQSLDALLLGKASFPTHSPSNIWSINFKAFKKERERIEISCTWLPEQDRKG